MTTTSPQPDPSPRRRGWSFLLGLLVVLLVSDALIAVAGAGASASDDAIEGAAAVEARLTQLARAAEDERIQQWLLIGDSVLVGDTGARELPQWREHRLLDYLRSEAAVDADARFDQLAYSGLLPVDIAELVAALDARDPDGRVALIIELSPRYFSPAYAEQAEHTRPWFADLDGSPTPLARGRRAIRWLGEHTPVYRHRARFADARERLAEPGESLPRRAEADADSSAEAADELEAFARLSVHYRDLALEPDSVQVAALIDVVARCRASGRRVAFVATPIEDRFAAKVQTPRRQGEYLAALDRLLEPDGDRVAVLPMDHPHVRSELFWDHVHLRPEGHRLLAVNLLQQLGVPLARLPERATMFGWPGVDASLVARIDRGFSDGASWQAQLDEPQGIGFWPGRDEVLIADTNNHVVRSLHGDQRIVSTLAGRPGDAGTDDGVGSAARLDRPTGLAVLGDAAFVIDGRTRALRRLELAGGERGRVTTVALPNAEGGSEWRIKDIVAHAPTGELYLVQARRSSSRIVAVEPASGATRVVLSGGVGSAVQVRALALDPGNALFFATKDGQIWRLLDATRETRLAFVGEPVDGELELLYANTGEAVLPQEQHDYYPYTFDKLKFTDIVDLAWVDRYGGLLVQERAPHPRRGKYGNPITARVHLRYLDLDNGLVYPWLKPLVAGSGYFYKNQHSTGFSSYFHDGTMALDPATATLYYVERNRSRLLRLEDGLLGVAKIGNVAFKSRYGFRDVLTSRAGARAFRAFKPNRHFGREQYTMLVLSSSMMAMTEIGGQYSMARELGLRLDYDLALREGKHLQLFQRTTPGGAVDKQLSALKEFLHDGGRPDIVIVETNASIFLPEDADEAFMLQHLDAIQTLVDRYGAELVIVDLSAFIVRNRSSLWPALPRVERFLELARARGLTVLDVSDQMLDLHLEVSPVASPPINGIHPTVWAVDAIADLLLQQLTPIVRARVERAPPLQHAPIAKGERPPEGPRLADAFDGAEDWDARLVDLPPSAVQSQQHSATLQAFIDVGQLPADLGLVLDGSDPAALDAVVLACLYEHAVRQRSGIRKAIIDVGRFAQYDEYGLGVGEGAHVLHHVELDHAQLKALVDAAR